MLLGIAVFVLHAPVQVVCAPNLLYPCINQFRHCMQSKVLQVGCDFNLMLVLPLEVFSLLKYFISGAVEMPTNPAVAICAPRETCCYPVHPHVSTSSDGNSVLRGKQEPEK